MPGPEPCLALLSATRVRAVSLRCCTVIVMRRWLPALLVVACLFSLPGCAVEDAAPAQPSPTGRFDDPSDLRALGVLYLESAKAEVFTPSADHRQQEVLAILLEDTRPWVDAADGILDLLEPGLVLTVEGSIPSRSAPDLSDGGVTLELVGDRSFCTVRILVVESADLQLGGVVEQMGCRPL